MFFNNYKIQNIRFEDLKYGNWNPISGFIDQVSGTKMNAIDGSMSVIALLLGRLYFAFCESLLEKSGLHYSCSAQI